ncbi:MAG: hypothetical protein HY820_38755 [Acidobacteria bacterium]|nr:hypothetical protein [Acidobacteriota bacterium]
MADDLGHVCSKFGIDRAMYRSFPLTLQGQPAHTPQSRTPETPAVPKYPFTGAAHSSGRSSPVVEQPLHSTENNQTRSSVLGTLLATGENLRRTEITTPRTISVIGAAGGVGATTIAASLARLASRRGRRVLLLDHAAESFLPLYLAGARSLMSYSGCWSFLPHSDSRQAVISVIACGGADDANERCPWQRARGLSGMADEIIIDAASHCLSESLITSIHDTACLFILVPDMRCALQVRNIEKKFSENPTGCLPVYLINNFDPTIPLHHEVQNSIAAFVGRRLIPFTIRCSQEIPQALAQGLTVVDYAPDSDAAHDLARIPDWFQQM